MSDREMPIRQKSLLFEQVQEVDDIPKTPPALFCSSPALISPLIPIFHYSIIPLFHALWAPNPIFSMRSSSPPLPARAGEGVSVSGGRSSSLKAVLTAVTAVPGEASLSDRSRGSTPWPISGTRDISRLRTASLEWGGTGPAKTGKMFSSMSLPVRSSMTGRRVT